MPKVSVIMGIYNCAETLAEAIDSILAQTYTDWQMIMCDDGSTDATYEIAQGYVEKYPDKFILLKNEKNMGLNYTLNHCLSVAESEYVARMDGDDISLPERFEKQVQFLDAHPEYAIVSAPIEYFDEEGVFRVGTGNGEPVVKDIVKGPPFCHAPCIIRRDAYIAVGGYSVHKKLLRVEDWHLWIKMYEAGYRGYMMKEVLYRMRDDRNAIVRRKFKYRINESRVIGIAVKRLKLCPLRYVYCLRPILVGLLPTPLYKILHRKKNRRK